MRDQFAAICGVQLREGARRQSGSYRFSFGSVDYDLKAVFTPKTVTIRFLA